MQNFLKILRWTVGLLFIFSGLIKANDPLGLSYKMQEFFDVWGMSFLNDYTLGFSLLMNLLEIITGIALIIQYPYKQTLWVLLVLIVFFSFLTGYALFSGKIKTCGCFGDCIPLSPKTSFIKDILLFLAIVILLINQKKVKTKLHKAWGILIILFASFGVGYGQYYVLQHLPFIDCLPYKTGKDIVEQMKLPTNAIADSIRIDMEFEKNGKIFVFDPSNFPVDFDSTYIFKSRKEVIVVKGNGITAPIQDFAINTLSGQDTTDALFSTSSPYVLVFAGQIDPNIPWSKLFEKLHKKHSLVYVVTADKDRATSSFPNETILIGDNTMIKTASRVWPTVFIMNGSTIMSKTAYTDYLARP